jgi:hypothetical protein
MFKIEKYLNFLLEKSTDSMKIYYSNRLRDIFKDIKFRDPGNIVSILLHIEDKEEYLDKYTLVDISEEKNDTLTFIQVNRIFRNSDFDDISLTNDIIDLEDKYLSNYRTEIGLGRWVNRVLTEVYKTQMLPSQISRLVDFYRSIYDEEHNESMFELVNGEEIRKWYNEDNYDKNIGQLGNSCMRYSWFDHLFDIYVENPDVCSLLIMYNQSKTKILGRSLVWKLIDGSFYQDRIYSSYDSDMFKIQNWATSRKYLTFNKNITPKIEVHITPKMFESYPYMDTLSFYNPKSGILSSDSDLWPNQGFIKLQDPEGGYISDKALYSKYHSILITDAQLAIGPNGKDYFHREEVVIVDGKYYFEELTIYSKYHQRTLLINDTVYSEVLDDRLDPKDKNVIKIIINVNGDIDWSVISRPDTYIVVDGKYYNSNIYIIHPFTKEYIFLDDKVKKEIRTKIIKDLNINDSKDQQELLSKIYTENKFDKDSLISQINNNSTYIHKIRGLYWGFSKDNVPTADDLLYGAFSYLDSWHTLNSSIYDIFNDLSIYNMYRDFGYRSGTFVKYIKDIYSEIDYLKVSEDMYKLYLLNRVF